MKEKWKINLKISACLLIILTALITIFINYSNSSCFFCTGNAKKDYKKLEEFVSDHIAAHITEKDDLTSIVKDTATCGLDPQVLFNAICKLQLSGSLNLSKDQVEIVMKSPEEFVKKTKEQYDSYADQLKTLIRVKSIMDILRSCSTPEEKELALSKIDSQCKDFFETSLSYGYSTEQGILFLSERFHIKENWCHIN